jgi:hypothetical protein
MTKLTSAIAAAVGTFGTGLITAASDGGVAANEWYVMAGAALVAAAGVYGYRARTTVDS